MTAEDLRVLLAAATPGEWSKPFDDGALAVTQGSETRSLLAIDKDGMAIMDAPADAALIAALRNAAPDLLRVVEAFATEETHRFRCGHCVGRIIMSGPETNTWEHAPDCAWVLAVKLAGGAT